MATSSLIQSLDVTDSAGTAIGLTVSDRRRIESFIAAGTIGVGDWVALDYSQSTDGARSIKVVGADGNAGAAGTITSTASRVVGVALTAASAGGRVDVVTRGLADASVTESGSGIKQGDALVISNTAGVAQIYAAASLNSICGYLVDALAAGAGTAVRTVDVFGAW